MPRYIGPRLGNCKQELHVKSIRVPLQSKIGNSMRRQLLGALQGTRQQEQQLWRNFGCRVVVHLSASYDKIGCNHAKVCVDRSLDDNIVAGWGPVACGQERGDAPTLSNWALCQSGTLTTIQEVQQWLKTCCGWPLWGVALSKAPNVFPAQNAQTHLRFF